MGCTGRRALLALGASVAVAAAAGLGGPREAVGADAEPPVAAPPAAPSPPGVPLGPLRVHVRRWRAGLAVPAAATVTVARQRAAGTASSPEVGDGTGDGPVVAALVVGADGTCVVPALPEGTWVARAYAPDGARGARQVAVAADEAGGPALLFLEGGVTSLIGRVDLLDGAPAAGTLRVEGSAAGGPPPVWATRLDAAGGFRLDGLPAGEVSVVVELDDGAVRWTEVALPTATPWTWCVRRASPRAGRVLADEDGRPVAGATVVALPPRGTRPFTTTTDAAGRYRLPDGDATSVTVTAPGFAPARAPATDPPGDLADVLLVRLGRVHGVVVRPDGAPVAGATVHLAESPGDRRTTSGPDGRFRFDDVARGPRGVWVADRSWASRDAGTGPYGWDPFEVDVPAGGAAEPVSLVVVPAARLGGRVVDAVGAPAQATRVVAVSDGHPRVPVTGRSRPSDGRFELDGLVPGVGYRVRAWALEAPPALEVMASRTAEDVVLRGDGRRDGLVGLRVVDARSGAPVVGARLRAWSERRSEGGSTRTALGSARTGPDGWTGLRASTGAPITFAVTAPGYVVATASPRGEPPFVIELTPLADAPIAVRVVDEAGRPVIATLDFEDGARTTTDREGRVLVARERRALAGARATAVDTAGTVRTGRARPVDGATEVVCAVAPARPRWVHRVRVLGPDGVPVARADVPTSTTDRPVPVVGGEGWVPVSPRDRDVVLGPVVGARGADGAELVAACDTVWIATGAGDAVLRLLPARRLVGRVRAPDGTPVAGARVTVRARDPAGPGRPDGGWTRWAGTTVRTRGDGRFDLGVVPSVPVEVSVGATPTTHALDDRPVAADATDVALEVATGTTIDLTVVDEDGVPAPRALVVASPVGRGALGVTTSLRTDDAGRCTLDGVRPGAAWDVRVAADDPRFVPARADRVPGGRCRIVLARARRLDGVVRSADGRPVRDAFVSLRGAGASAHRDAPVQTGADGRFAFTRVGAGPVEVRVGVGVGGGEPDAFGWPDAPTWEGLARRDLELTVDVGDTVEVTAREADGDPATTLTLVEDVPSEPRRVRRVGLAPDGGRAFFAASRSGWVGYAWLPPDAEGRAALRGPLRPGDRVELQRAPTRPTTGHVRAPAGADLDGLRVRARLAARPELVVEGEVGADGRFTLAGLVAGATWEVHATLTTDAGRYEATATDVRSGASLELDLSAAPRPGR